MYWTWGWRLSNYCIWQRARTSFSCPVTPKRIYCIRSFRTTLVKIPLLLSVVISIWQHGSVLGPLGLSTLIFGSMRGREEKKARVLRQLIWAFYSIAFHFSSSNSEDKWCPHTFGREKYVTVKHIQERKLQKLNLLISCCSNFCYRWLFL